MAYVLVIDDEPHLCWLVEEALSAAGYRVKTATTWQKGLALAQEEPPALVLVDLNLPGRSGLAVLEELARLAPGMRGIVMTGESDTETLPATTTVLQKPFDLGKLRHLVKEMLRLPAGP